jgi:hypothetical protein
MAAAEGIGLAVGAADPDLRSDAAQRPPLPVTANEGRLVRRTHAGERSNLSSVSA